MSKLSRGHCEKFAEMKSKQASKRDRTLAEYKYKILVYSIALIKI